jgi:phosphate transport system substrate-binding protein
MTHRLLPLIQAAALASLGALYGAAQPLTINGSTTVNLPVVEAAEVMRAERGLRIHVDTQGGSSGGIAAVADDRADIGMSSKALTESDRRKFPGVPSGGGGPACPSGMGGLWLAERSKPVA